MSAAAVSFEVQTTSVDRIAEEFEGTATLIDRPAAGLVFCSGHVAGGLLQLAEAIHESHPRLPVTLVSGPGVLSERGELENVSATTGLIWRGGRCEARSVDANTELGLPQLESLLAPTQGQHVPTLLFIRSEGFDPQPLWQVRREHPSRLIFGAGTYGDPGIVCCDAQGVRAASAAALHIRGLSPPRIRTSHSCRLLSQPMPVTKADGSMVLEINGEPALELLERLGSTLEDQPLVFTVLAEPSVDGASEPAELLVRGIQGIDPDRKGLLISDEIRDGMQITFAVRDAAAARRDVETLGRRLEREIAGAAPRFSLYFNCTGRGRNLHNSPNVDTRLLRERFGDLPMAGFQSAFEIAPFGAGPALQLYTGVLAVFCAPS